MLIFAILVVAALKALPTANAASHEYPVWFGAMVDVGSGVGGGATGSGPGGGFQGFLGAVIGKVPSRSFGLEARVGESVWAGELRTIGNVDFDVRYPAGSGPFAYVGFAHRHELGIDEALTHVVGAIAATYPGITHRTGFEVGGGWDVATPFPNSAFGSRIRPTVRLAVTVLPDAVAPPVYITGNLGITLGIGKVREPG